MKKQNKYFNQKVKTSAGVFDSKGEYSRYSQLLLLQKAGKIKELKKQDKKTDKHILQEGFRRNGKKHQTITYTADYSYFDLEKNKQVIEDYKSEFTRKGDKAYPIKKKLLLKDLSEDIIFREVVKSKKGIIINDL